MLRFTSWVTTATVYDLVALLADMLDMGRYWLYVRSGDVPPQYSCRRSPAHRRVSGNAESVFGSNPVETDAAVASGPDDGACKVQPALLHGST
jgi:hypothetical protein